MGEADLDVDNSAILDAPETTDNPAEVAPTTTDDTPAQTVKPEDEAQKKIAEQAFKRRVAEREADGLRKQLEALQQANPQARPVVPAMPDALALNDEQLRQATAQRDEAIRQAALHDSRQNMLNEQRQATERASQQAQHEAFLESAKTYSSRATQLGVKPEELQAAGKMVAEFGVHDDIAAMILEDEQGPLITKYLAQNLQELDDLSKLPLRQQIIRIEKLIKPKAATLKPRVSSAPDPTTSVRGVGMVPASYGGKSLEGAKFE